MDRKRTYKDYKETKFNPSTRLTSSPVYSSPPPKFIPHAFHPFSSFLSPIKPQQDQKVATYPPNRSPQNQNLAYKVNEKRQRNTSSTTLSETSYSLLHHLGEKISSLEGEIKKTRKEIQSKLRQDDTELKQRLLELQEERERAQKRIGYAEEKFYREYNRAILAEGQRNHAQKQRELAEKRARYAEEKYYREYQRAIEAEEERNRAQEECDKAKRSCLIAEMRVKKAERQRDLVQKIRKSQVKKFLRQRQNKLKNAKNGDNDDHRDQLLKDLYLTSEKKQLEKSSGRLSRSFLTDKKLDKIEQNSPGMKAGERETGKEASSLAKTLKFYQNGTKGRSLKLFQKRTLSPHFSEALKRSSQESHGKPHGRVPKLKIGLGDGRAKSSSSTKKLKIQNLGVRVATPLREKRAVKRSPYRRRVNY